MKKNDFQDIIQWYGIGIFRKETEEKMKGKSTWVCIIFLLAGLVIGGLIGELTSGVNFLWWLSYGQEFGLAEPITFNLNVVRLTFGIVFKINIASIIGVIISMLIYKKAL